MKKLLFLAAILTTTLAFSQSKKDKEIIEDSKDAKAAFLEQDEGMSKFFNNSYGYVIFPNVGKGWITRMRCWNP